MNHIDIRERLIPLPGSDEGYSRVLLLGTTGAGKTTVVRQLLGTDPKRERFPSTSTAKTTVAETEIIPADVDAFDAAVTFMSEIEVHDYLWDNIVATCVALDDGKSEDTCHVRLLDHESQRFRLSYLLGRPAAEDDDFFDDEDDALDDDDEKDEPNDLAAAAARDLERSRAQIAEILHELKWAVDVVRAGLPRPADDDPEDDGEAFVSELGDHLMETGLADRIIQRLLAEIRSRFAGLPAGAVEFDTVGWPVAWTHTSSDRAGFLRDLSLFYSNSALLFGALLTPLVDGIRVRGRFIPTWSDRPLRIVLLDGEGLGHKAASVISLSSSLVTKIDEADSVLLVDNATQPMQAAPIAAMSQIAETGNVAKLRILFTHLDGVSGPNLRGFKSRIAHVTESVNNAIGALEGTSSAPTVRTLRRRVDRAMYFVGNVDRVLGESKAHQVYGEELARLSAALETVEPPSDTGDAQVEVERRGIGFAVEAATARFQERWAARVGLGTSEGVAPEHWSRVKALCRRFAGNMSDEYDTLRPVADFRAELQREIYRMLQNPVGWRGQAVSDEAKEEIVDAVAAALSRGVLELAARRVTVDPHDAWVRSFELSGAGSTTRRARMVTDEIIRPSSPIPTSSLSPEAAELMHQVERIFDAVAETEGLHLR